MDKLKVLTQKALSRRSFLAAAGTATAAALITGCSSSSAMTSTTAPVTPNSGVTDADILNFALNLEYLEAEFYLRAATGSGLATADIGSSPGTVTGGARVPNLTSAEQEILYEIAYDEQQHVRFLRSALGAAAVARPTIDFTGSFPTLATAAGITGVTFNPFTDFDSFLVGAFIFEDVGVTAYHGAAPLISAAGITSGYLSAAAGIMAVEAYHAAYVRTALTGRAIAAAATPATSYPYLAFANKISALRSSVGGGNETTLTVPTSISTPSSIVAADTTNAIAFSRSTDQVLHIVYGTGGTAGVSKGGFFPSGLNGTITVTAS